MDIQEIELATRGQVNARRNYIMGLWAGRMIGVEPRRLPQYVVTVMQSDYEEPGPGDVVRKISRDLVAHGIDLGEAEILRQLKAVERNVRAELLATD